MDGKTRTIQEGRASRRDPLPSTPEGEAFDSRDGRAFVALLALMGLAIGLVLLLEAVRPAAAAERLLVCGPCSSSFLPVAQRVLRELGLEGRVEVVRSSCLGACAEAPVIEYRGTLHVGMTEAKLRKLLSPPPSNRAP